MAAEFGKSDLKNCYLASTPRYAGLAECNCIGYSFVRRASASQALIEPMSLCRQSRAHQRESNSVSGRERPRGRRADTCRKEPKVLHEIVKGAQMATKECQHQFRNRRWNCTTARKSLRQVVARGTIFHYFFKYLPELSRSQCSCL